MLLGNPCIKYDDVSPSFHTEFPVSLQQFSISYNFTVATSLVPSGRAVHGVSLRPLTS
jgi:hypothetical protein